MTQESPRLRAIVLGSGAGGGVPQWNCGCQVCARARAGDPHVPRRTQASVAVSADGTHWLLICASPDLRQQMQQTPTLAPHGLRHSPLFGVVLINAEIDGIAGLLSLREGHPFTLFAPHAIQTELRQNPVFDVLTADSVQRRDVVPDNPLDCGFGLTLTVLPMPGKPPLYREAHDSEAPPGEPVYAALMESAGHRILVAPACASVDATVRDLAGRCDVLLFDGTVFTDDELITAGVGRKTGRRMGHVPLSGPDGALAALSGVPARRILLHVNNTNPVLIAGSPERRHVEAAGWEVAYDGMEVTL